MLKERVIKRVPGFLVSFMIAVALLSIAGSPVGASLLPDGNLADGTPAPGRQTAQRLVVVAPVGPDAVYAGHQFDVAVQADDVTDLHGAQATLLFDSSLFSVVDVQPGPDLNTCLFQFNEPVPGELNLALACNPGEGASGAPLTIWVVTFQHIGPILPQISFSELEVVDVILSDGQVPPQSIPAVGGRFTLKIVPGVCGDQNGDGEVNIFDVITDLQIIVGLIDPTPEQRILSDVVIDGQINIFDGIFTLQHIVGLVRITDCGLVDGREIDEFPESEGTLWINFTNPPIGLVGAHVSGPSQVEVDLTSLGDTVDQEGNPGANGLEELKARLTRLQLTGNTFRGPSSAIVVSLNPDQASNGQIEEKENVQDGRLDLAGIDPPLCVDPIPEDCEGTAANSYFDVFFEIDVDELGLTLRNRQPHRLRSMIDHKPPTVGIPYVHGPDETIELVDDQGVVRAVILASTHIPRPHPTDHFKCYSIVDGQPANALVRLQDQFDDTVVPAQVGDPFLFCNPTAKFPHDPDGNIAAARVRRSDNHLKFYRIVTPAPVTPRAVVVSNQFGMDRTIRVFEPLFLAVPTQKGTQPPPRNLDHFKCYRADGPVIERVVDLRDQFHTEAGVVVLDPVLFCNPTRKFHDPNSPVGIRNVRDHLVCYRIDGEPFSTDVATNNQFGREALVLDGAVSLCVPTRKEAFRDIPIEVDRFEFTRALIGLRMPDGTIVNRVVGGPATVHVDLASLADNSDEAASPGAPDVPNGLEEVRTELVSMVLTGGDVTVRAGTTQGLPVSPGQIEEKQNIQPGRLDLPGPDAPFCTPPTPANCVGTQANSYFDVLFEIQLPDGTRLRNRVPLRLEAMIDRKPPLARYKHVITQPIQLFDESGQPTGIFLVTAEHNTRRVEIDHFDLTRALVGIRTPTGALINAVLSGPATVHVDLASLNDDSDEAASPGAPDVANGLEEVDTELVSMVLSGGGMTLRAGVDHGLPPSPGQIEEKANVQSNRLDLPGPDAPFCTPRTPDNCVGTQANSYFDVLFQVQLPSGMVLHNRAPLRVQAMIDSKPPFTRYIHVITNPIPLLDANNNQTGYALVSAEHNTRPIEVDHFERTTALVGLRLPDSSTQNMVLSGPATVEVDLASLAVAPGFGTERVATELVSMELAGSGATLRAGSDHGLRASLGQIREDQNIQNGRLDLPGPDAPLCTPPTPANCVGTTATSSFEVFFEVDVPGVGTLHNETPLLVEATIKEKPPRARYFHFIDAPIRLFDANGSPTEFFLVSAQHITGPVEIDHFRQSRAQVTLVGPNGSETIQLAGPTTVAVFFEGAKEGDADDTDGDGRDEVETEIVSMDLRGNSPTLGPVMVRNSPTKASTGIIAEQTQLNRGLLDIAPFATGPRVLMADSSFNIFFEIAAGRGVLHNIDPKVVKSVITHKPPAPGEGYESPEIIPLYDQNDQRTQFSIGPVRHIPNPRPGVVEVDIFENTRALVALEFPNGTETLVLRGPAEAHVFFEGAKEGDATDDDGDGQDEVKTEMMAMKLLGSSNVLGGEVEFRAGSSLGLPPSVGEIEELENTQPGVLDVPPFGDGEASSSFIMVFEVELLGRGVVLVPDEPLLVGAVITHKPPAPGNEYLKPAGIRIPLRDPQGNIVATLVRASHVPVPPPVQPDLTISIVEGPGVSCFGTPVQCDVTVQVNITNIGPGDAGPFNVQMVADAVPNTVIGIPGGLAAGASTSPVLKSPPGGNCFNPDCTVVVTVDSGNAVAESDESNNTDTRTVLG